MKPYAITAAVALGAVVLVGCDDGPKCLESDIRTVHTTTIVNGKVVPSTSIVSVCTKYEKESAEHGS